MASEGERKMWKVMCMNLRLVCTYKRFSKLVVVKYKLVGKAYPCS